MAFRQRANTGSVLVDLDPLNYFKNNKCQSSTRSEKTLDPRMYFQWARVAYNITLVRTSFHTYHIPSCRKYIYIYMGHLCQIVKFLVFSVLTGFNKVTYFGPHLDPIRQQANMARKRCNHRPNHGTFNRIIVLSWVSKNCLS